MRALVLPSCVALGVLAGEAKANVPVGYDLVWADEFNGTSLNEDDWYYRADVKQNSVQLRENVSVSGGHLVLDLRTHDTEVNGTGRFASGAGVISRQRFRYGYYETRAKFGDGINQDGDQYQEEGWHHAFWAQLAVGDSEGNVDTTFPSVRRTEIDGYENGSGNLNRLAQHVLPWNSSGNIIRRLPGGNNPATGDRADIHFLPDGTEFDWHTYGFLWTPEYVDFYVDGVQTIRAIYSSEEYEHTDVNLWLTAISTDFEVSRGYGVEDSEARYDYFRFFAPSAVVIPEPASLSLLALGGLLGFRRRRA